MGYRNKPFEELDVMDDFLISAIAADREVGEAFCRKVLSVLLGRKIGKIKVMAQHTLPAPAPEYRGIRMDVEVEEYGEGQEQPVNVYDLEPHRQTGLNLPRHNRFYQAKMDARCMQRGEKDFSVLPNLFVVTILNFDPFGYGYMLYTIENHCTEVADLKYEDGLKFLYFYTGGTKGGNEEISTMLRYLQHSTADNATDAATRELHDYVCRVKVMPEVRQSYMTFEEYLYYQRKEAAEEAAREASHDIRIQSILELLEDYGEVSEELKEKLETVKDMDLLKKYHKLAAKAGSIAEFQTALSEESAVPRRVCPQAAQHDFG